MGLHGYWKKGYIRDYERDAQPCFKGIECPWHILEVDGIPYRESLLDKKVAGSKPYTMKIKSRIVSFSFIFLFLL